MRTDGRTDMTKLIVAFSNFVNAPKKDAKLHYVGFPDASNITNIVLFSTEQKLETTSYKQNHIPHLR